MAMLNGQLEGGCLNSVMWSILGKKKKGQHRAMFGSSVDTFEPFVADLRPVSDACRVYFLEHGDISDQLTHEQQSTTPEC